jgi:hypothetical protein
MIKSKAANSLTFRTKSPSKRKILLFGRYSLHKHKTAQSDPGHLLTKAAICAQLMKELIS